jgi:hypothetical protein
MQVIRWYLLPLETRFDGVKTAPVVLRVLVQGRWTLYALPGLEWALARIRGEDSQHATLSAAPGIFSFPRGRGQRWNSAASTELKERISLLGIGISGDPFPDEVLDLIGSAHKAFRGDPSPWDRSKESRGDEVVLGALEQV